MAVQQSGIIAVETPTVDPDASGRQIPRRFQTFAGFLYITHFGQQTFRHSLRKFKSFMRLKQARTSNSVSAVLSRNCFLDSLESKRCFRVVKILMPLLPVVVSTSSRSIRMRAKAHEVVICLVWCAPFAQRPSSQQWSESIYRHDITASELLTSFAVLIIFGNN